MVTPEKLTAYCLARLLALKEKKEIEAVYGDAATFWKERTVRTSREGRFTCQAAQADELYKMYPRYDMVSQRSIRKTSADKDAIAELVRTYSYEKVKAKLDAYIVEHSKKGYFQDLCRALRSLSFDEDNVAIDQRPKNQLLRYD